ncbi:MAG: tetraacyldisaccharide 4'-kinase [Neisseriaceae bacterium]
MKIQQIIEKHWYQNPNLILSIILFPFCIFFFVVSKIRRLLYRYNILTSYKLPVPVVIIGNISVGGVGKTPLTKYIAQQLITRGIQVGVILRGYKSKNMCPTIVNCASSSLEVGDEALIYAQNDIPVAIGRDRYLAGCKLLEKYPNIKLILSDDGLQHYRLKRDYEIVVVDQTRMFGNSFVLPMGPLRETVSRLNSVNTIIINGKLDDTNTFMNHYNLNSSVLIENQTLILKTIYNPATNICVNTSYFSNLNVCAMAAMGNPGRFFDFIVSKEINLSSKIIYPDHHHYTKDDIPDNFDAIIVTEKDYTKLAKLNNGKIWVVQIEVKLSSDLLVRQIFSLLNSGSL